MSYATHPAFAHLPVTAAWLDRQAADHLIPRAPITVATDAVTDIEARLDVDGAVEFDGAMYVCGACGAAFTGDEAVTDVCVNRPTRRRPYITDADVEFTCPGCDARLSATFIVADADA